MKRFITALRNPAFLPWLIVMPAVVLRCWEITASPLWYDEAFTRLLAGLPWSRLIDATAGDVHPPLYYLIVSLFGTSAFGLRFPSVVLSVASLPVFWHLTRALDLPRPARLAALGLIAYHPVEIFYAMEARSYALLQFLVLFQFLAVYKRRWALLGIVTGLVLYTHNYGLIYTAVAFLVGFLQALKRPRPCYRPGVDNELTGTDFLPLTLSFAIPGLAWLPWAAVLLRQVQAVSGNYWIQPLTPGSVFKTLLDLIGGYNVPSSLILAAWFAISAGLVILLIHGLKTKKLSLLVMAYGPLALAVGISMVGRSILLHRGLIGMLPPLAALAGSALVSAKPRGRWIGAALLAPLAVATLWQVGVNHAGSIKSTLNLPPMPAAPLIVHLNWGPIILTEDPSRNVILSECPPEGGAISERTRRAIGFRSMGLEELPEHYVLVGAMTGESNKCTEDLYHQLTAGMVQIERRSGPFFELGIWGK